MRLWHIDLIPKLPRQQLLGQWREIHAIIGTLNKRGKVNHSTVNYVNDHPICYLFTYAILVRDEMKRRGYKPKTNLFSKKFKKAFFPNIGINIMSARTIYKNYISYGAPIYPEHNDAYLQECLENLRKKGIEIDV